MLSSLGIEEIEMKAFGALTWPPPMFLLQRSFCGLAKSFTAPIEKPISKIFEDRVVCFSIT